MTCVMVPVEQAREKARAVYKKNHKIWAAQVFAAEINPVQTFDAPKLLVNLKPPSEKVVLDNPQAARAWVRSWRDVPNQACVQWGSRSWASVGSQLVPEKLSLEGIDSITSFGKQASKWKILLERTRILTELYNSTWRKYCPEQGFSVMVERFERAVLAFESLSCDDWEMLLSVVEWLIKHPQEFCYARELPIRGIDTKWVEKHRKAVMSLYEVFVFQGGSHIILKAPSQVRVRFLDERLAPGGLMDISASVEQLDCYKGCPRVVVVCENLISLMTLPMIPGVIALHGSGYGVSGLEAVEWLKETPVLYWGDIDSHGFAILNQWRHHHALTQSVMMDRETFDAHRDLCVIEPSSNNGVFECLSEEEQATLGALKAATGEWLRLEQERIEWDYAQEKLQAAVLDVLGLQG